MAEQVTKQALLETLQELEFIFVDGGEYCPMCRSLIPFHDPRCRLMRQLLALQADVELESESA